tara:strand:+ start:589 stop:1200 length:612 start_codon:yes stop_codon:yes gene_type:complete
MKEKLKLMLKDLIECIDGPWFVGDGALLGIVREGDLLDFDDDIDIFILPETKIDWTKLNPQLNHYKDYVCHKVYDPANNVNESSTNEWLRYIQYNRIRPQYRGFNRAQLCKAIAPTYRDEIIYNKCNFCWIDIFTLEHDELTNNMIVPYYFNKNKLFYYTKKELQLKQNDTLGFTINIPNNTEEILQRQYGETWKTENKKFKY